MENPFKKFIRRKTEGGDTEDATLYPGLSATSKRLLGLREFAKLNLEDERRLLQTESRFMAYASIDTTTNPRKHKVEFKKGIVREILANDLVPEKLLKETKTLYLGSGIDVEYPLALGARTIWLVDPVFESDEAKEDVKRRIENLIKEKLPSHISTQLNFSFDFGQGNEEVRVTLVPHAYGNDAVDIPTEIGLVIKFASQGPSGELMIENNVEKKIVKGGYILDESDLINIVDEQKVTYSLGK